MYLYKIGYTSYEEAPQIVLAHEALWTQQEFERLIYEVTAQVIEQTTRVDQKDDYREGLYTSEQRFEDYYEKVAEVLVEERGFRRVQYQASFMPFGWPSIFNSDDWKSDRDEQLAGLTRFLNERGMTKEAYPYCNDLPHKRWEDLDENTRAGLIARKYDKEKWNRTRRSEDGS